MDTKERKMNSQTFDLLFIITYFKELKTSLEPHNKKYIFAYC